MTKKAKLMIKTMDTKTVSLKVANTGPPGAEDLWALEARLRAIRRAEHYAAESECREILSRYRDTAVFLDRIRADGTLNVWCRHYRTRSSRLRPFKIRSILKDYHNLSSLADAANKKFIRRSLKKEKEYLDRILSETDPDIRLDADQRRAVLTDADHCLVVAGAGAGKTTTVAAKVKYLADRKHIDPKRILVISFTNKAVQELQQRINRDLGIPCPVMTFHSLGYSILRRERPDGIRIADEKVLPETVREVVRRTGRDESPGGKTSGERRRLTDLIGRFIVGFKTNGFGAGDLDRMLHALEEKRTAADGRTAELLRLCKTCFLEYERVLQETGTVDFQDMINRSVRILREKRLQQAAFDFRYIIVDEYQDISRQRFDLVRALRDAAHAKIVAVGDDWQSVYAFSGADISLFTQFEESMGSAELLKIVRTYRNSQEVIDIAGRFIQKNRTQIRKKLISGKHLRNPVIIIPYDSRGGEETADLPAALAVETALEEIRMYDRKPDRKHDQRIARKRDRIFDGKKKKPVSSQVLLIGRFGFDADFLERSGRFAMDRTTGRVHALRFPEMELTFLTAHSAKGLGFDNVIVLNGRSGTYGFPCKRKEDPLLSLVLKEDRSAAYAEERRLFYVAMTRTRGRVWFIMPRESPSEFLKELIRSCRKVRVRR